MTVCNVTPEAGEGDRGEPHIIATGVRVCGVLVAGKPCGRKILARGWCSKHYQRWLRHKDPDRVFRAKCPEDVAERFWRKVAKTGDCWIWIASAHERGYGNFMVGHVSTKAHRFAYELVNGPIPDGLQIDHKCGNTSCVRPEHLRAVTDKQNSENLTRLRSDNKSGVQGVVWNKAYGQWQAGVRHHGKQYHVGYFTDLREAEVAVVAKRNELFTHNDRDRESA